MIILMAGLDHKRADIEAREKFAITKEKTQQILTAIKQNGFIDCSVSGSVIISTCNRTELYISVENNCEVEPARLLCHALDRDYASFKTYFTERANDKAMEHLCRVASGLYSQIMGDDQVITQVREALELSRGQNCTDSFLETMFRLAIQAAKAIKTKVILKSFGISSIPEKAVEKLKTIFPLTGLKAVVIGNGQTGRLVSQLLIRENVNVTVTLRENKKGEIVIPQGAGAIGYNERYKAIEDADIVVSATTSPHFTLRHDELCVLARLPKVIVDLAVPRDVEPTVQNIGGVYLLTLETITGETPVLPPESISMINTIIAEHIEKYNQWYSFKVSCLVKSGEYQI